MKYVFLDTCVIVDCAFASQGKIEPEIARALNGAIGG